MDCRERLFKDIKCVIADYLDEDDLSEVTNTLLDKLSMYEISERCTEITTAPTINKDILATYAGCLKIANKSEKTIKQYVRTLNLFADFVKCSLLEVGTYDIRRFLASLMATNSPRSIKSQRANISAFYNWLFVNGHINNNPCLAIESVKIHKEIKKPFSETDIKSIRMACEDIRDRMVVDFLLATGVRVTEFVCLELADIDFEHRSVHIRYGKGDKERIVYFNDVCENSLIDYLSDNYITSGRLAKGARGDLTASGVEKILKRLEEKSGVGNVHPHRFRRTFATDLIKRGCPIEELKKLLGHTNINTTMEYVFLDDTMTSDAYKKYAY